jgi:hypothetical protein
LPKPPPKVRDRHGRGKLVATIAEFIPTNLAGGTTGAAAANCAAKVFVPTWCDAGPPHRGDGSLWPSVAPDGALLSDFVADTPQIVGQIQRRKTSHEDPDDYW